MSGVGQLQSHLQLPGSLAEPKANTPAQISGEGEENSTIGDCGAKSQRAMLVYACRQLLKRSI